MFAAGAGGDRAREGPEFARFSLTSFGALRLSRCIAASVAGLDPMSQMMLWLGEGNAGHHHPGRSLGASCAAGSTAFRSRRSVHATKSKSIIAANAATG